MTTRSEKLAAGKFPVDAALVARLVAEQFPHWAGLPVEPVAEDGWDNWTFRLGSAMKVRLPSAEGYAGQTAKESHWLPRLAPHLPCAIPAPLATGAPNAAFPWAWSVYGWIEGEPVTAATGLAGLADDVADFLNALQAIDPTGGPVPGAHNYLRGAHPVAVYGAEARRHIELLRDRIDVAAAQAVLDTAQHSAAERAVWVHGDMAAGNLLLRDGRLSGVLDFGCLAVGDPSCDLAIAWVVLDEASRRRFRARLGLDAACWARGRAWALWKAALLAVSGQAIHPAERPPLEVIAAILADHRAGN